MFFLKSGSAISTHNACLCPPMLLALILIGAELVSTSSLASKTHTSRKHMMGKLEEPAVFSSFLISVPAWLFLS